MRPWIVKKYIYTIGLSLIVALSLFAFKDLIPFRNAINHRLYDSILKLQYYNRKPPVEIKDITLVLIDGRTLNNMPSKWPYPRSDFAATIKNLKNAGAKIIAFDFAFFGRSTPRDDAALGNSLKDQDNIVLACSIDENGLIDLSSIYAAGFDKKVPFGIITKLQDEDGVTRRGLTYLVSNEKESDRAFLSWEMQILKIAKSIDLSSISDEKEAVTFKNSFGETWTIPVSAQTRSFLINFTAHTFDFNRLSFYDVLENKFDQSMVRNKIILIGLASSVLADIHNTPIGWLPGVTLNANALLTLYGHDFLSTLPDMYGLMVIIIGVTAWALVLLLSKNKTAYILIIAEIGLFFLLSYVLLITGYVWNYFDFPFVLIVSSLAAKKMADLTYT